MQVGQAFPEEANMKWYGHRVVKKLYRAKCGKFCNYIQLLFMISRQVTVVFPNDRYRDQFT